MKLNVFFKERMFLLIIFAIPVFGELGDIIADIFNLNNTMGWKLAIMNTPIDWISGLIPLLFLICYGIMNLLKINTNLFFSKLHLILIALSSILFSFTDIDFTIIYLSLGISVLIFLTNIFISFTTHKHLKHD
jgi:hypothetical protein